MKMRKVLQKAYDPGIKEWDNLCQRWDLEMSFVKLIEDYFGCSAVTIAVGVPLLETFRVSSDGC